MKELACALPSIIQTNNNHHLHNNINNNNSNSNDAINNNNNNPIKKLFTPSPISPTTLEPPHYFKHQPKYTLHHHPSSPEKLLATQLAIHQNPDSLNCEDPFFVADIGRVISQYKRWNSALPRVRPYYAIKCNPDPVILRALALCGAGFDCASKAEIQSILDLQLNNIIHPSRDIIFANPCKQTSHVKFASSKSVDVMTFDNIDELVKIKLHYPNARMVLRILADDSRSVCQFGIKFGASIDSVPVILAKAKELDINVIGISFHVGSGCFDASAFSDAVILARRAFDIGLSLGFDFTLLDIGGGFPGDDQPGEGGIRFEDIVDTLRPTIDLLFPEDQGVKIIAEPGRFFASACMTLAVNVTSRRVIESSSKDDVSKKEFRYYINDGLYGSFNCIIFDHVNPPPKVLYSNGQYKPNIKNNEEKSDQVYACSIWGPTCDSMDCITNNVDLPELQVGDWLYFENMGAYTNAAASAFNGFKKSSVFYANSSLKKNVN